MKEVSTAAFTSVLKSAQSKSEKTKKYKVHGLAGNFVN